MHGPINVKNDTSVSSELSTGSVFIRMVCVEAAAHVQRVAEAHSNRSLNVRINP